MRFKTKLVFIEAEQFLDEPFRKYHPSEMFLQFPVYHDGSQRYLLIETLEGTMKAVHGDWIIKGLKGEFYPCKPDIFAMKYEPVE